MKKPRAHAIDAVTPRTSTQFARHPLARAVHDSIGYIAPSWPGPRIRGTGLRGLGIDARVLASAGLGLALSVNTGALATPIELSRPEIGASRQELVIIDAHVPSVETLEQALRPGLEAVVLDPDRDGVEQIADILAEYSHVEAVHLVSHGESGRLQLGNTWLSTDTVGGYRETLASWFPNQSDEHWDRPDLLVYGCEVADGTVCQSFLAKLSALTGADVTASVNRTRTWRRHGQWVLEAIRPAIRTPLAFDHQILADSRKVLRTFTVINLNDSGPGSLRAAVEAANTSPGPDQVVFEGAASAGRLRLKSSLPIIAPIPFADESLTIMGPGADRLTIQGGDFNSFHIEGSESPSCPPPPCKDSIATLLLSGVTMSGTRDSNGRFRAALHVDYQANLDLRDSVITGNNTGIRVEGDSCIFAACPPWPPSYAEIENTIIDQNQRGIIGGDLILRNSRVTNNAESGISVLYATVEHSTISENGRGISASGLGLRQSTISGNGIGLGFSCGTLEASTVSGNGSGVSANSDLVCGYGRDNEGFYGLTRIGLRNSTITGNKGVGVDLQNLCSPDNEDCFLNVENTIIEGNDPDCHGLINSLGNNILGDPNGCDIILQSSDLTGDAGLGEYVDPGGPGQGRVPLSASSLAIDSASPAACAATDQLDTPRADGDGDGIVVCDRGAVEFYPLVEDQVTLKRIKSGVKPTPQPGAPGGTVTLKATFTNSLDTTLHNPFFEVTKLKPSAVLLNAEGAAGAVGARLWPNVGRDRSVGPGESFTAMFKIGLQAAEPLRFDVGLHGDPEP